MLFSEAMGRKVVSTTTAETVGRVEEFVVDPGSHTVIALILKKTDAGNLLRWNAITAFGVDAVTIPAAEVITTADTDVESLIGKGHRLIGGLVLSSIGDELGKLVDIDFDASSGIVTALHLRDQQVEGVRLVGVGSYAVVVDTEAP